MKLTSTDLRKTAELLKEMDIKVQDLKKQAEAAEFLFDQIGRGLEEIPKNKYEFKSKVAEYLDKDLNVLEEASKLASSNLQFNRLGELDESSQTNLKAEEIFVKSILEMRR